MKTETIDEVRVQEGQPVEAFASQLAEESRAESNPEPDPAPRRPGRPIGARTKRRRPGGKRPSARVNGERVHAEFHRPGAAPPPPPPPPPAEDDPAAIAEALRQAAHELAPLIELGVGAYVDRRWPKQPYSIEEAEQLSLAAMNVAVKYGAWMERYAAEIALVTTCIVQFGGRAREERKQAAAAPFDARNAG